MLKRIGRRFYAAKYVYSIHLHGVSPWFMHEKPARVTWKRGSKKHKKGQTEARMPVRTPGAHINNGSLKIEETFELGVTLYAESNKTKKTGPYGTKELKLVIMEVGDDGGLYSILGNLTINLNEYVGLMDHKLRIPIDCDSEIVEAVGQPYFDITIRSWYKQGTGGTSTSSGISSTGWTEAGSDSEEDPTMLLTTGDSHEDPVKLVDTISGSPKRTSSTYTMDSVPENLEVDGNVSQEQDDVTTDKAESVQQTTTTTAIPDKMTATTVTSGENSKAVASLQINEEEKNNVQDSTVDQEDAEEEAESPPAVTVDQHRSEGERLTSTLDPSSLMLHRRFDRLSTITSEAGDEALALEENDDELNKFLKAAMVDGEVGLEGLPDAIMSPTSDSVAPIKEEEEPQQQQQQQQQPQPQRPHPSEPSYPTQVVKDAEVVDQEKKEDAESASAYSEINSSSEKNVNKADVDKSMTTMASPPIEEEKRDDDPTTAIILDDDVAPQTSSLDKRAPEDATEVVAVVEEVSETTTASNDGNHSYEKPKIREAGEAAPKLAVEAEAKRMTEDVKEEVPIEARVTPVSGTSPTKPHPSRYSSPRRYPPTRSFWSCLPGGEFLCCQPTLPREP